MIVTREMIYEYVKENPRCTTTQIAEHFQDSKYCRLSLKSNTYQKCKSYEKYGMMSSELVDGFKHWTVVT